MLKEKMNKYKQNVYVVYDDYKRTLYSYNTPIIMIDDLGNILKVWKEYNYSVTTIKHMNYFLQEFNAEVKNRKELENLKNFKNLLMKEVY